MSTILVVDDDEYMRDLLHLHLTNAGYEVGGAAFLRKPLLANHLLATVAGYVEGGRIAL